MDWRALVAAVAVVGVVGSLVGVVVTLLVDNPLFRGSESQTAAIVTLAVVVGSLVVFAVLGGPSDRWRSTPYW